MLAKDIAIEIRQRIREELQLTASAGVSYNKFLAKIASDYRKPDGMTIIHPDRAIDFIDNLSIEKFWGVGPRTASRMHYMGIFTGGDLRKVSLKHLQETFGKMGQTYYDFARGIDLRPVEAIRVRKSIGCERTLEHDISTRAAVIIELYHTAEELIRRLEHKDFRGNTLTLKIKYHDFTQITRSITQDKELLTMKSILPLAKRLMAEVEYEDRPIRLIGLSVSNPRDEEEDNVPHCTWEQLWLNFEE